MPPSAATTIVKRSGAAWYSGAGREVDRVRAEAVQRWKSAEIGGGVPRGASERPTSTPLGRHVREVMDDLARETLVANVVEHASDDVSSDMQLRVIA